MQQPALLAGHVSLPSQQPLNVGVAHVMRQPSNNSSSSKKSKPQQMSNRSVRDSHVWGFCEMRRKSLFFDTFMCLLVSGTCRPMRCPPPRQCCPLSARSVLRRTHRHAALWYKTDPLLPAPHPRPVEEEVVEGGEKNRPPAQRESTMYHTTNTRNTTNTTLLDRPSSSLTPQVQLLASSPSAATQTRRMSTSSPVTPGQRG